MSRRSIRGMAAALLVLLAGVLAPPPVAATDVPPEAAGSPEQLGPDLDAIRRFVEVYRLIKSAYVEPVDDQVLIEGAIRGMLDGLDPHSGYLELEALKIMTDDTMGAYDGLGVEVMSGAGILQVMGAMPGSPAEQAGLRSGDFITHIDGVEVDAGNMTESLRKLRGRPGTRIALTVANEERPEPRQVELVRARIRLSSVRSELLEPGYGLVSIDQCQPRTAGEVHRQLQRLRRESGGQLHGVVLDLRGNPGGALDAAVAITDLFLAEGRIASIEGRIDGTRRSYDAHPGGAWEELPLAVLIDQDTASGAEIIAAALQAHDRAPVLGSRSYGKGSVQNIFGLDREHAARLTTARYLTADGRSIHGEGVTPDIQVDTDVVAPDGSDPAVRRALQALSGRS